MWSAVRQILPIIRHFSRQHGRQVNTNYQSLSLFNSQHFNENNSNRRKYYSNGHNYDGNSRHADAFAECKCHLLTSRILETVGWLGAALIVGLNFECRYRTVHSIRRKRIADAIRCTYADSGTHFCDKICGKCSHCHNLLLKLVTFASPHKTTLSHALPQTSDNVLSDAFAVKVKVSESANEDVKLVDEDPIDEICRQLQSASLDYIEQLNNLIGIALIETDPTEALRCWKSCKNTSAALFNIAIAFESGKHTKTGESDLKSAFHYYQASANLGHKFAIYNLALFYLYGKGNIAVDVEYAHKLLKRAAQLGVKRAQQYCKQMQEIEGQQSLQSNALIVDKPMKSSSSAPNLLLMSSVSDKLNAKPAFETTITHFKLPLNCDSISSSLQLLL